MLAASEFHWWYRGRRRIVAAELAGLTLPPGARLLDAGCGGGNVLPLLAEFGRPTGVDPDPDSVDVARSRGYDAHVASLPELPFEDGTFAACTCLDVIEHLTDDRAALAELGRVTEPGGALLVTVPAYEALWSSHDVANEHVRRYRARRLREVAADSGWRVERLTYFNTLLLPAAAAVRWSERFRRRPREDERSDLHRTPAALNTALETPMRLEAALLRRGGRLPAGLSLLGVMRKGDAA